MGRTLLTLVLCLLVLAPQRVCTCAAASTPCTHQHHDESDEDGHSDADAVPGDSDAYLDPAHRHEHQPDCAVLNAGDSRDALKPVSPDTSAAEPPAVAFDHPAFTPPSPPRPAQVVLGPPHVPLFLSLLVLRN